LITDQNFRYLEVYNATEGFFAFQDRPDQEGMLLMCHSGIYFEFVRLENYRQGSHQIIDLSEVTLDEDYVFIITTASGLLRYVQGDIIRFVTLHPYRIKITGRLSAYINAFGEDLMPHHVDQALALVNEQHKVSIHGMSIAPYFMTIDDLGKHEWYIEFVNRPSDLKRYGQDLDKAIRQCNTNYDQKRSHDLALESLEIVDLPIGTIQKYFIKYSREGGQSKLQRLRNDRLIAERLGTLIRDI